MAKSGVFKGSTIEEEKVNRIVDTRLQEITFRSFEGKVLTHWQTAYNMFKLFDEVVSNTVWKDANELKENYKRVCEKLIERDRLNFVVRNCAERMLKIFKQKCYDLKIELKESQGASTIQSLRHLNIKKVSSVHRDDFDMLATTGGGGNLIEDENNPFANMTSADFQFAKDVQPKLSRRSTMALKTTRAG